MLDNTKIGLHPDKIILESTNGNIFLHVCFNDIREDLLIQLNLSQINSLCTELSLVKQKSLIASEYLN